MAYGQFTADLRFDKLYPFVVHQHMVAARVGYAFAEGWTLGLQLGAIVAGDLSGGGQTLRFTPGFVASIQAGVLLMEGGDGLPFVESTVNLSVSTAMTEDTDGARSDWLAVDVRLGATTGWRIYDVWVPYVALRFFAGPVFWTDGAQERVGSDVHHYQVAIGSSLTLGSFDLFVDWGLPLGEAGLSAGLGARF